MEADLTLEEVYYICKEMKDSAQDKMGSPTLNIINYGMKESAQDKMESPTLYIINYGTYNIPHIQQNIKH
jgi:hypothetical protein